LKKKILASLIRESIKAIDVFGSDSIKNELTSYHHLFLCNRLFLLNLASIYTTGFECPDTARVIPELKIMLEEVNKTYLSFNESFSATAISEEYLKLFGETIRFVNKQPIHYSQFDNFIFIKNYVNPLFGLNQKMIIDYNVRSKSLVDYSINKNCNSIFNKSLYMGQNPKGIFLRVKDEKVLEKMNDIGKLLFYDPILSGNNLRSCASCHKPTEYFTDTIQKTALHFNRKDFLPRNTPSLINAEFNHLLMLDGMHISLQNQAKAVMTNLTELGEEEQDIVKKVLSCKEYEAAFNFFLKYTPQEKEITIEHISSVITLYYSKFSKGSSDFDEAMNNNIEVSQKVKKGLNLFMSKAQCATCHFVPQFNGVKPPFVGSEFEVLGVPNNNAFEKLSADKGRYTVNPADETLNAFRTGSIRNAEYTKPYMHNGVFNDLKQVIDFYNSGGGAGRGLSVNNQTLSSNSLNLTEEEKNDLIIFIKALNEKILFEEPPVTLPVSKNKNLNVRKVGGEY
jgi:cytochrome c peroxidase